MTTTTRSDTFGEVFLIGSSWVLCFLEMPGASCPHSKPRKVRDDRSAEFAFRHDWNSLIDVREVPGTWKTLHLFTEGEPSPVR